MYFKRFQSENAQNTYARQKYVKYWKRSIRYDIITIPFLYYAQRHKFA